MNLKKAILPKEWKISKIIPIPKTATLSELYDYRPTLI